MRIFLLRVESERGVREVRVEIEDDEVATGLSILRTEGEQFLGVRHGVDLMDRGKSPRTNSPHIDFLG